MKIFTSAQELNYELKNTALAGLKLGFVPTMGALHSGHISLIKKSKEQTDLTICSIFVNPTQFNEVLDFAQYPRTNPEDISILESNSCDILFMPSVEEMYPDKTYESINFDVGNLNKILEGNHRPGHFNGVAAVVKRLLDLVQPSVMYLGQKDFQQVLVLKKLIKDFEIPVNIVVCETLREADGLAMSSRNRLLTIEERKEAPFIFSQLNKAKEEVIKGGKSYDEIREEVITTFKAHSLFTLEYIDICSAVDLSPVKENMNNHSLVICIAARLGTVRLIDNVLVP